LHGAAEDFRCTHDRFRLDLAHLVDAQLDALRPFLVHRPTEWAIVERFAEGARARAAEARDGLAWGICHGDLAAGNLRVGAHGRAVFLDFDLAAPGWRAYDLASVSWVAADARSPAIWDSFVEGYREIAALPERELDAVDVFHALRRLWSLGTEAVSAPAFGSHRLAPEHLGAQLRFFAAWEAEHRERGAA
jgi:Ser/Thr protein kinase RdoA (MazF antagonist)